MLSNILRKHDQILEMGGVPHLIPLVQRDKIYNIPKIAKSLGYTKGLVIGPGGGPFHVVGVNCELMTNLSLGVDQNGSAIAKKNETHCAVLGGDERGYKLMKLESADCCLLGNMFISEGDAGKVIKVTANKRTAGTNFVTAMRNILKEKFGDSPVSMGGVFLIKSGRAKLHVMPDFSEVPLNSDDDVNNWLKYFEANAPLVCLSVFHSMDPGLDLRIEHTHCFSTHGDGGHYHYDTTPDDVEYEGYFNVAHVIHRVDQPKETHSFGRD